MNNQEEQKVWNLLLFMLYVVAGSVFTGAELAIIMMDFKLGHQDAPWFLHVAVIFLDLQAIRYYLALHKEAQTSLNKLDASK